MSFDSALSGRGGCAVTPVAHGLSATKVTTEGNKQPILCAPVLLIYLQTLNISYDIIVLVILNTKFNYLT